MSALHLIELAVAVFVLALAVRWLWWWLAWRSKSDKERAEELAGARGAIDWLVRVNLERARKTGDGHAEGTILLKLAEFNEERGDFKAAIRDYRSAGRAFAQINSPDAITARDNLDRLRKALGSADFDRIVREIDENQ